ISGSFLFQLALVIYLTLGGHRTFLDSFTGSFVTLPVLAFPEAGPGMMPLMDLFIKTTGEVLYISIQIAAPIIIAIFVADIILGIANRVAPQINVWELGFNVKGYVGILLLFVAITVISDQMEYYLTKADTYTDEVILDLKGQPPTPPAPIPIPEEGQHQPEAGPPPVVTPPP
ncbi:MAG: flagellar biosynthetic protein FliR, partial [Deltaproteobacteria bacterium]|nr:flagellar biosynthetic protein FliR [Deltaproteobacteria bacterium]